MSTAAQQKQDEVRAYSLVSNANITFQQFWNDEMEARKKFADECEQLAADIRDADLKQIAADVAARNRAEPGPDAQYHIQLCWENMCRNSPARPDKPNQVD